MDTAQSYAWTFNTVVHTVSRKSIFWVGNPDLRLIITDQLKANTAGLTSTLSTQICIGLAMNATNARATRGQVRKSTLKASDSLIRVVPKMTTTRTGFSNQTEL